MNLVSLSIILLATISLCYCKITSVSIHYQKMKKAQNYSYIIKFSYDIGQGSFVARAKFSKPLIQSNREDNSTLTLAVVIDDKWEEFQSAETCKQKLEVARLNDKFVIPNDGRTWGPDLTFTLAQVVRRRTYFFTILDCEGVLNGKNPSGLKIDIQTEMLNIDNSHFSSEEEGFLYPFFFLLIICSVFLSKNMQRLIKLYNKEEELDWAFLLANVTLIMQILNIFFEWIHMLIYSSNGKGSFVLQLFGQLFGIAAQFTMAILFILISWGWTINYSELENFDIYIPLAVLLGIVHMMIVGLSKLTDDESHKFHQYGGFVGWIIVFLRLGMFIYFLFGIKDTLKTAREKVKVFIYKFVIVGSLYFLAFPVILFITSFIADYVQHRVITIGTLVMQSIAIIFMSFQFTSKSSGYNEVSIKANPLLPYGKLD
ncbi:hypothetical protein ABPG72_010469 [Tetrahymena utriculariae]